MAGGRGLKYVTKRGFKPLRAGRRMVLSPASLEEVTRPQEGSESAALDPT